jgi:hypothetical protein
MSISFGHGWEVLNQAIVVLSIGNGDIRERLQNAFICHLSHLKERDLPQPLWSKFSNISAEISITPTLGNYGSVSASIKKISEARAIEMANQIFDIFAELSRKYFALQ